MLVSLSMSPNKGKSNTATIQRVKDLLHTQRGVFRTGEALKAGVHPRTLYMMLDQKVIEKLGRGIYRFADMPSLGNPDLATVAMKVSKGVICLISALSYHELTTEIPHEIYIALPRGTEPPRLDYPPLRIFWFSGSAFSEGIEQHDIDGIPVKVYNPEKTLADCFKYRNKIGLDVVLDALKFYRQRKRFQADDLMHFARICRVEKIMRPYLEATL
jgi:predicted transcriptional regulator of viral defense system